MKPYPRVLGEVETIQCVLAGRSLSRYGDGELKMASHMAGIKSQCADERLTRRLHEILSAPSGECLIAIPNIHGVLENPPNQQKVEHWSKFLRYATMLSDRTYGSAFVTRPDSAPWIDTPEYWAMVESLWIDQDVTLVRGSGKSLTAEDLTGARTITEIVAPRQHAWAEYESIMERIGTPSRALICLGPTATVMAVDLCAKGVQAIDLGHVGLFLRKHRRGEPMWLSKDDKRREVA